MGEGFHLASVLASTKTTEQVTTPRYISISDHKASLMYTDR